MASLRTSLNRLTRVLPPCSCSSVLAAAPTATPRQFAPIPSTSSTRFFSSSPSSRAGTLDRTPMVDPLSRGAPLPPTPPPAKVVPTSNTAAASANANKAKARIVKPRKAALSLTPGAVERIQGLLNSPEPKLIRIGVRNKGCAGMSYHLEYVDKAERFDEVVEQDGVKVIVDSKALFSIIGSTMDWQEDALQAKFVFKNPNIKDACGCGESFIV